MKNYVVNLTNPEDIKNSGPSSFGSGNYGHTVKADSMTDAIKKVRERAEKEGYVGKGWSANIVLLNKLNQKEPLPFWDKEKDTIIDL